MMAQNIITVPDSTAVSGQTAADSIPDYDAIELGDVTVTATTDRRDAVTQTITVTDAMREGTNSAIALLGNVPGITLDRLSETIKVGFDSNVPILVDGIEVNADYAKNITPDRVYKVEIMRHPSGRYANYPVVVNLKLKTTFQGWDMNLHARSLASLKNEHSNTETTGGSYTYSTTRWNLYANLDYKHTDLYEANDYIKDVFGNTDETVTANPDRPNIYQRRNIYTAFMGWDYKFSYYHRLTAQATANFAKSSYTESYDMANNSAEQKIHDDYKTREVAGGLFYDGLIGDKLHLNAETYYDYYYNHDDYSFIKSSPYAESLTPTSGEKHYAIAYVGASYDFTQTLRMGLNNTFTFRKYTVTDRTSGERDYDSDEYRNRADINISWQKGNTLYVNGGMSLLTVKNRNIAGSQSLERTIWSPLPYARLYWRIIPNLSFNANYYYSISYPDLEKLSPVSYYNGNHIYRQGNPSLKAMSMHYVQGELDFKGMLKLTYMHRFSDNDLADYFLTTPSSHEVIQTYANSDFQHSYIGIEGDFNLTDAFNWHTTASYQWYRRSSDDTPVRHGHTWYLDTQASYSFKSIGLLATASYLLSYDKRPLLQGKEYTQQETLAIGLNKSLMKDRLSIGVMATIPVNAISKTTWKEIQIPDFYSLTRCNEKVNQTMLLVTATLSLGNNKSTSRDNSLNLEKEK